MYLLKFSDNSEEYTTEVQARIDCYHLYKDYNKYKLNKHKKKLQTKSGAEIQIYNNYTCTATHDKLEYFNEEPDSKYFADGQSMWSAKCLKCSVEIVNEINGQGTFKPSIKCPAFTCINRTNGFYKTMCNKCAVQLMIGSSTTRSRRNKFSK